MKSIPIKSFLSCSFKDEDKEIVSLVAGICEGLDIKCSNVSEGYTRPPQDVARDQIDESDLFIAIATRREEDTDGNYMMPQAVNNEISIAFGMKKPMLILKENGVTLEGFDDKYATYLEFERDTLKNVENITKLISSFHGGKLEVIQSHDLIPEQQDSSGFYQEYLHTLYELDESSDGYVWKYWTTRKLVFTKNFSGRITNGAWATIPRHIKDASRIKHDIKATDGSKSFELNIDVIADTPEVKETSTGITPKPEKDDWIVLTHYYESPYLNRIYLDEESTKIRAGEKECDCIDGVVPIVRTKQLKCQFRFPESYGLKPADLKPLVGSYAARVDYLVESEVERANWGSEDFGGNVVVSTQIQSPLLRHVYGFHWDIPKKQGSNKAG